MPMRFTTPMLRNTGDGQHASEQPQGPGATATHPPDILPKMVCLPSSQGVGASEMKNLRSRDASARKPRTPIAALRSAGARTWLPLVLGPALAMDSTPAPVCFSSCKRQTR